MILASCIKTNGGNNRKKESNVFHIHKCHNKEIRMKL